MPQLRVLPSLLLLFAGLLLAGESCREKEPVSLPVGVPKGEGVPVYFQSSGTLGPAGGELSSADGRVTLRLPPGALKSPVEIAISPVSNTAPLGVGNGYRLFPRSLRLEKPATLVFQYVEEETDGSTPEALGIARQDEAGIWQAHVGAGLNSVNNTLSLPVNQFGDWSVFRLAAIVPNQLALLPGQKLELRAWQLPGSSLLDAIPAGRTLPLGEPVPLAPHEVTGWLVNGNNTYRSGASGSITPATDGITFTAPAEAPSENPVRLGAAIRLRGAPVQLVARVTIGGVTTITLNGGPFREHEIAFSQCIGAIMSGGNLTVMTARSGATEMQIFYPWYNPGAFAFDEQGGVCGVSINLDKAFSDTEIFLRSSTFRQNNQVLIPATGTVRVSSYGEIGGLITGTFAGKVWYRSAADPPVVVDVKGRFSGLRVL